MTRKKQVLVIGFGRDHCPEQAYKVAYQVGVEVARQGALLLTGDLSGVLRPRVEEPEMGEDLLSVSFRKIVRIKRMISVTQSLPLG